MSKQYKELYAITKGMDGKSNWHRIGAGFVNKDGSLNIRLDLQLRDPKPKKEPTAPQE